MLLQALTPSSHSFFSVVSVSLHCSITKYYAMLQNIYHFLPSSLDLGILLPTLLSTASCTPPTPYSTRLLPPSTKTTTTLGKNGSDLKPRLHSHFCCASLCNFCRVLRCNFKIARVIHLRFSRCDHLRFSRCDIPEVSNMLET